MMKILAAALLCVSLSSPAWAGRQMAMETPSSQTVPNKALSLEQIRLAIVNASQVGKYKWQMLDSQPNQIEATLTAKKFQMVILIDYTQQNINYRYKSSVNLDYENENGKELIHPHYNKLTFLLSREIERQLDLVQ